jgi:chorismate-pyruvate lyase
MSAIDLFEGLKGIDVARLTPLQRILLVTDGTLTEILEAHLLERIELVKVSERTLTFDGCTVPIAVEPDETVLERKINLRGARSGAKYVYAESLILVDRLEPSFQRDLLETNIPLGRLWRHQRLETYKQLASIDCRPARELSIHLDCAEDSPILARAYDVFSSRRPIMRISEFFCAAASG